MPQLSLYAIVFLVLTNATTFLLWRGSVNVLIETAARGKVAQERAEAVVKEQKQITEETSHAWNANLVAVRDDYARRLRIANRGEVPRLPDPPARIDEVPADALPLAGQCAETTLQLMQLQDWIAKQERNK